VLQLSPADQVKVVTVPQKAAAAGNTEAAQAACAAGVTPALATKPDALISAANVRGQLQAAAAELVESQVLATAGMLMSMFDMLLHALPGACGCSDRACMLPKFLTLQSGAPCVCSTHQNDHRICCLQMSSFTSWRDQNLAIQQAMLQHKQDLLLTMFPPPVPPPAPMKGSNDKIAAAKAPK
jgi:hypothetical protein